MRSNPLHRAAFTLVELLVVISIFVLLLALAVPAFSSMLYSSEQSLAEQSLRVALNTARNVAVASPAGRDSAAVFTYDQYSRKVTIVVCTKAGELVDEDTAGQTPTHEIFAAASGVEPVQLSAGWTIRGFAPANSLDVEWYGDGTYSNQALWDEGHWVFPETSFYDVTANNDGMSRQSFMVRFEGGTGLVKLPGSKAALVLSPSESEEFRGNWPAIPSNPTPAPSPAWDQFNNPLNPLHADDQVRFVQRVLAWPEYTSLAAGNPGPVQLSTKRQILGMFATDMILCKPVGQLALCKESRLAAAIGARLDASSGCLYRFGADDPELLINGVLASPQDLRRINEWVEGRLLDANGDPIESDCRVFTLQRYLGWLQEVTGTRNGLGVGS